MTLFLPQNRQNFGKNRRAGKSFIWGTHVRQIIYIRSARDRRAGKQDAAAYQYSCEAVIMWLLCVICRIWPAIQTRLLVNYR